MICEIPGGRPGGGSVYVLSARRDDLLLAEPLMNRRRKLAGALIRSVPGLAPEFTLEVTSMESLTLDSRMHLR